MSHLHSYYPRNPELPLIEADADQFASDDYWFNLVPELSKSNEKHRQLITTLTGKYNSKKKESYRYLKTGIQMLRNVAYSKHRYLLAQNWPLRSIIEKITTFVGQDHHSHEAYKVNMSLP